MKSSLAQSLILVIAGTLSQGVFGAEPANSLNFGFGGLNPMPHCEARVYTLEYEHRITPTMVILGRGSGVNYTDDDSDYLEDGRLRGIDIGARYYRAGRMQGFYTGASLGYWENDWTFIENRNTANPLKGDADTEALRLNIDVGYRFPIRDTNISIMPEVNIGKFFSSSSCDYTEPASLVGSACDQNSDVEAYLFAGVSLGVAF
ncbi:MAG TPA: autotransporter outer membrane beta-barrel domain-containing protein [Gammaproteobacteria bacterium]